MNARRENRHGGELVMAAIVSLVVLVWLGHLAMQHLVFTVAAILLLVAAAVLLVRHKLIRRQQRHARTRAVGYYHQLSAGQFEHAIADLCRRDGCRDVEVVGGAGDLAADVIATTPDRRRILIQAKHYRPGNPVRSPALQAVNGTYRDIHKAQLAAVVTTSSFTKDAAAFGSKVGLRLLDEQALAAWASRSGPAPWQ